MYAYGEFILDISWEFMEKNKLEQYIHISI